MSDTIAKITINDKRKQFILFRKVKNFFKSNVNEHAMKALEKSIVELKKSTEKSLNAYLKVMKLNECPEWIGGFRSRLIYTVDDVIKRHVKNNGNKSLRC